MHEVSPSLTQHRYFSFIHKALAIESRLCDKLGTRLNIQPPVVATMRRDGDATLAMM